MISDYFRAFISYVFLFLKSSSCVYKYNPYVCNQPEYRPWCRCYQHLMSRTWWETWFRLVKCQGSKVSAAAIKSTDSRYCVRSHSVGHLGAEDVQNINGSRWFIYGELWIVLYFWGWITKYSIFFFDIMKNFFIILGSSGVLYNHDSISFFFLLPHTYTYLIILTTIALLEMIINLTFSTSTLHCWVSCQVYSTWCPDF